MTITRDTPFTEPHISDEGVRAILATTLYQPYTDRFLALARQYSIDPLWCLAYLRWENGFSYVNGAPHFSWDDNNPWDILCRYDENWSVPCSGLGVPNRWGADGCVAGGGVSQAYCYAHYPNREIGLEAGFRNWRSYAEAGIGTYYASLNRALCGIVAGCPGTDWTDTVIATASQWSDQYPYTGELPALPSILPVLLGAGMIAVGGYLVLRRSQLGL